MREQPVRKIQQPRAPWTFQQVFYVTLSNIRSIQWRPFPTIYAKPSLATTDMCRHIPLHSTVYISKYSLFFSSFFRDTFYYSQSNHIHLTHWTTSIFLVSTNENNSFERCPPTTTTDIHTRVPVHLRRSQNTTWKSCTWIHTNHNYPSNIILDSALVNNNLYLPHACLI